MTRALAYTSPVASDTTLASHDAQRRRHPSGRRVLAPTRTNAMAGSCVPAQPAKEPGRDNVLGGMVLLASDNLGSAAASRSTAPLV
jgi:hypothetical protein